MIGPASPAPRRTSSTPAPAPKKKITTIPPPETPLTAEDVNTIMQEWARRLYLTHWDFAFDATDPLDKGEAVGEMYRYGSYDSATLRLGANYATWDRKAANLVIVHELMHLVTRDIEWAAESVEDILGTVAYSIYESRIEHELEGHVDRMATILVELGGVV